MTSDVCENCRFWLDGKWAEAQSSTGKGTVGECRRYAPQLIAVQDFNGNEHPRGVGGRLVAWPYTLAKDWCGEFQARAREVP